MRERLLCKPEGRGGGTAAGPRRLRRSHPGGGRSAQVVELRSRLRVLLGGAAVADAEQRIEQRGQQLALILQMWGGGQGWDWSHDIHKYETFNA